MAGGDCVLELSALGKSFPGVRALDEVSMRVLRGSVHVIVGENGAGKSTLMKIIDGIYEPDSGEMRLDGAPYRPSSPTHARSLGISMIFQELNVVPELSVAENIFLGREPMRPGGIFIDDARLNRLAAEYIAEQGLGFSPADPMKSLSVSQAQMVEIVKAISCKAKLVIMDEPTSAITDKEVGYLFEKIAELKRQGVTVIYISHKMDEIFRIADYISVLRDGRHIETRPAAAFNRDSLIELMVGRELGSGYPGQGSSPGPEALRIEGFTRGRAFRGISFSVRKGEILGIAGLMGAGRTEVARAIFGLDPRDSGEVYVEGARADIGCVDDAIGLGIVMVSEDRRKYGIIPMRSVTENANLVGLKYRAGSWWIDEADERAAVREQVERLGIKAPSAETEIAKLSGGNQQKVILAKWLLAGPKVMILDEPTRGIDVGAKYEIYKLMRELCERGIAIVMISSELPELIGMSDRILVMCAGRIAGTFERGEATQVEIMRKATGGIGNA